MSLTSPSFQQFPINPEINEHHELSFLISFPVGGLTPPGRSMDGRKPSRFATVEGEAKQLSAPGLRGSLTNRTAAWGKANEKGKMRENPKLCRHFVQIDVPAINSNAKFNLKHVQAGRARCENCLLFQNRVR